MEESFLSCGVGVPGEGGMCVCTGSSGDTGRLRSVNFAIYGFVRAERRVLLYFLLIVGCVCPASGTDGSLLLRSWNQSQPTLTRSNLNLISNRDRDNALAQTPPNLNREKRATSPRPPISSPSSPPQSPLYNVNSLISNEHRSSLTVHTAKMTDLPEDQVITPEKKLSQVKPVTPVDEKTLSPPKE